MQSDTLAEGQQYLLVSSGNKCGSKVDTGLIISIFFSPHLEEALSIYDCCFSTMKMFFLFIGRAYLPLSAGMVLGTRVLAPEIILLGVIAHTVHMKPYVCSFL